MPATARRQEETRQRTALLTRGPLPRAILYLAAPEVVCQLFRWAFVTADTYFVGKLGGTQLAALSGASFAYWALQAFGYLLSTGVVALVARRTGEENEAEARASATQGILWALPYGVGAGLLFLLLADPLLHLVSSSPEAAREGAAYLQILAAGAPVFFAGYGMEAAFRGIGDPITPLLLLGLAVLLNLLLDPLFIFAMGMGVKGAAWATLGSQALGTLLGIFFLWRRGLFLPSLRLDSSYFWRVCRIGAPLSASLLLFSVIYLVLAWIIAPYGDAALAGLTIGHRVESLPYLISVGLGGAATTLVGQALGAGEISRAQRAAWRCTSYALVVALLAAALMVLFPEDLARLFNQEGPVVLAGTLYLQLIALSQAGTALEVVLEGAFSGAGDTLPPMVISTTLTAARIPLGAGLAIWAGLEYVGVYWAITLTGLVRGLLMAAWFARGRWKQKRV